MARKHNVFMDAVSEMKHFLLGAALVLVLVTVVPALAQEGPGGPPPGGNMPPPMNQGGGMPPPPQGGQPQGGQQFGGQPQGGQQQPPMGGQQFGGQPQGGQQQPPMGGQQNNGFNGQQNGQFGQPQGGNMQQPPMGGQQNNGFNGQQNGQFGQPSGQQPGNMQFGQGMNGKMGGPNNGEFKCFSDLSAKTPAECDAADDKAGFKKGEKFEKGEKGDMKGSPMSPANGPANNMPTAPSKFDFPTSTESTKSTKSAPSSKFAPEFKLDLSEFEDNSIVDGEAVFSQVLEKISLAKLTSKNTKPVAVSVATYLASQAELLCGDIDDEDDASDCEDLFLKYVGDGEPKTKDFGLVGKSKDSKKLLKNLIKLRDAYFELAGFDIPESN